MKEYQTKKWLTMVEYSERAVKGGLLSMKDEVMVAAAKDMQMMWDFIYKVANAEVDSEYVSFDAAALLEELSE